MLWCALYANDDLIGHVTARRIQGGDRPDDINTYDAVITSYASAAAGETSWRGEVTHPYSDGGWQLVRAVVEASEAASKGGP